MIFYILAALTGVIASFNLAVTGALNAHYGPLQIILYINIIGLVILLGCLLITRTKFRLYRGFPLFYYAGGICAVLCSCFTLLAYRQGFTVTSVFAIMLFSSSLTSLISDFFGLFAGRKERFAPKKLIGFGTMFVGTFLVLLF